MGEFRPRQAHALRARSARAAGVRRAGAAGVAPPRAGPHAARPTVRRDLDPPARQRRRHHPGCLGGVTRARRRQQTRPPRGLRPAVGGDGRRHPAARGSRLRRRQGRGLRRRLHLAMGHAGGGRTASPVLAAAGPLASPQGRLRGRFALAAAGPAATPAGHAARVRRRHHERRGGRPPRHLIGGGRHVAGGTVAARAGRPRRRRLLRHRHRVRRAGGLAARRPGPAGGRGRTAGTVGEIHRLPPGSGTCQPAGKSPAHAAAGRAHQWRCAAARRGARHLRGACRAAGGV